MKTKQAKEDLDKSTDEDTLIEPKTRARKKASDIIEDDKAKPSDEPKTSKEPKKTTAKPKAVVKKRPLGIRKALRSKKAVVTSDKIKNVIKQTAKRGRKPAKKVEPAYSQDKDNDTLIPPSEIKKEPGEETSPNSRSSSPKNAGRRPRVGSDMMMMKSVFADTTANLLLGSRTSPYPMRSERSNSPSTFESKNLRSGKPRKAKSNLLNEVVMKEQKKKRRLLSDSKLDSSESNEECKKLKRGRSCSREGSEISKCSDITDTDISLGEIPTEAEKELNKKSNKPKTDLDLDNESNIQISTDEKVPSHNFDSKLAEIKPDANTSIIDKSKKKINMSLIRSTSLDSDNNNSNRIKLEHLNTSDIEDKLLMKTDNDTLFEDRSSILDSMSKTFNSKDIFKSVRKCRRGGRGKVAGSPRSRTGSPRSSTGSAKNGVSTATQDTPDEKVETIETLSKEIDDLINNLDKNINDQELDSESNETKPAQKLNTSKPLSDNNIIVAPDTVFKEKEAVTMVSVESTPTKNDDSENIKLHYEDDPVEKPLDSNKVGITYNIPKLMGRLKEFEEFDKIRQRQETKPVDKQIVVSNDVVLIPKSGADVRQLKDIQSVKSPERAVEKENLLSCFENNSAISILKRDQSRKSIDIDLTNSVTLIKRNSVSSRKESTSSNHSRESDAISIFEKSLGKDVTLTEIKKPSDKQPPPVPADLNQLATLQPTTPTVAGMGLDSSQISITPRISVEHRISLIEKQKSKRKSLESLSRKSSESTGDSDEKMAILEKIKTPPQRVNSPAISITPTVAVKSPEIVPMEIEASAPPIVDVKDIPTDSQIIPEAATETKLNETVKSVETKVDTPKNNNIPVSETKPETATMDAGPKLNDVTLPEVKEIYETEIKEIKETEVKEIKKTEVKEEDKKSITETLDIAKPVKSEKSRESKSARNSIENLPGPSNALAETPESQKRKENVLRTLGLLTHKAANEAKIEKQKEKERINALNKGKAKSDYTGTLKTVIKLNRGSGEKKKYRNSLKMTFKTKNRGNKHGPELGEALGEDDAFYTIERREGVAATSEGGHRKAHYSNRLNNHADEAAPEPEPTETLNLVIPEKASSFSIHPGRVCMDQCFYCGGKFGLYDTPCHIAQMKSSERQRKVLHNEEKLTVDSCLCDACYRHVDRRANCPSYRRKTPKMHSPPPTTARIFSANATDKPITSEKAPSNSPPLEEESEEESGSAASAARPSICHTEGCTTTADCSIRRKWLIKMRTSVNKVLRLQGDYPGLHTIPLCSRHHSLLAPLRVCALCSREPAKLHAALGHREVNPVLREFKIPVQLCETSVLCKLCRYYCGLVTRAGDLDQHARGYTKKLLQIHNVEVPAEFEHGKEDQNILDECSFSKSKVKKSRTKSKQRKSSDPDKPDRESSEQTTESSSPEKEKDMKTETKTHPLEEDIESLISSNKIPVPGAKHQDATSDGSEIDPMDVETHLTIPVDKQTELQYLLQKQNNPAQFLTGQPNLTLKHKSTHNIKGHNAITKPGHQQRIHDKNSKRIHKIGQIIVHKEKPNKEELPKDGMAILTNLTLNEECTIESIPMKKTADIATLKNKWQMSESFTQVKKNLSELSKKLPAAEKDKKMDAKYSNPVKRLETNPSISVRELFPGEEEMSLQCNIEFNNVKGITPEGWEKCNSLIQYDVETKKLWTELQRPYGNQSSFLRHLILLEKYFRSGDLVLSHNATPNAANYSDSVQSRLRAYDNVVTDAPRRSEPAISLMVTETPPAKPEHAVSLIEFRKKPSVNGKSLLKSNNTEEKEPKKIMPPPAPTLTKVKNPKSDKPKHKPLPPELIAINTPNSSRKAMHNVLHNIQQLVKGVTASDPIEVATAPLPAVITSPAVIQNKVEKKESVKSDTPKKKSLTSKPWRPTLMPITPENLAKIAREPTQVAVDGRKLPSLVQVMSSGKRYHITLQDYNKMCVMRREKLQQIQDGEKPKKKTDEQPSDTQPTDSAMVEQWLQRTNKEIKKQDETTLVTEIQPSAMLGNGGTVMQNIQSAEKDHERKEMPELNQISTNAATILKSVGLKNITIAAIPAKTATVTSHTASPASPAASLIMTSTPLKLPQLGPAVSITSETVLTPSHSVMSPNMIMPKIPKSLTVIPQTIMTSVPVTTAIQADGQKP